MSAVLRFAVPPAARPSALAVPAVTRAAPAAARAGVRTAASVEGASEVVPVPGALVPLLPAGGVRRGATIATGGIAASSLALALAGPSTAAGAWVAVVGLGDLGLVAAADLGVDLERVVLVGVPASAAWPAAVAALLDAFDLVLVRAPGPVTPTVQRRLAARSRDRGSTLVQVGGRLGAWAERPDLVLTASAGSWVGLGAGHGHLAARQVVVEVTGRRAAARPRRGRLWLPGPGGGVAAVVAGDADRRPISSVVGDPPASRSAVPAAAPALAEVG